MLVRMISHAFVGVNSLDMSVLGLLRIDVGITTVRADILNGRVLVVSHFADFKIDKVQCQLYNPICVTLGRLCVRVRTRRSLNP